MKLLVALICGVTLAFAQDETTPVPESGMDQKKLEVEQKAEEGKQTVENEKQAEEQKKQETVQQASSAASAVKGKLEMHVTKNVRRLQEQNATGFAYDKNARQAAKQAIATTARTDAEKVKVHVNEEPGTAARRLIGETAIVGIDYIIEAANSTDAQVKHDLLKNTSLPMLTLELTNALVALGDPIYTVQVGNHTVDLASQEDVAAFDNVASEVTKELLTNAESDLSGKGSTWWYWVVGGFGIAALAVCCYFCIAYSQTGKDKKKKKEKSSTRGVDITPSVEAPPETASLAANPAPTPMYQPMVNNAQFMQPVQYVQYPQLVAPAQYMQPVQVAQMQPMAVASVPAYYQ